MVRLLGATRAAAVAAVAAVATANPSNTALRLTTGEPVTRRAACGATAPSPPNPAVGQRQLC